MFETNRRLPAILLLLLTAACGRDTVEWSDPRTLTAEQRPTQWNLPTRERLSLPDMRPAPPAEASRQWTGATPSGWEALPAQPARFRDLLWRVEGEPDTECYLSASQRLGPLAANMSRWYGQFAISEVAAVESLPVIELAGKPGRLLELVGTFNGKADQAMLLAFRADGGELTMTLKFTGPSAIVQQHEDGFLELAKSLRSSSGSPMPNAPPIERGAQMPEGHPPVPGDQTRDTSTAPASGPFAADLPAGWTPVANSGRLLHCAFGTDGEVYVSQLGGTLRQSFDIWRGEMGQDPMTDADFAAMPKVAMLGTEGMLMDVGGDFRSMGGKQIPGARMLVAASEQGGSITFAKLVGTSAVVETQRAAFLAFCKSMRRTP
jgi:hypothetical protein